MVHWKVSDVSPQYPNRIFERPLGLTELGFYWDGNFNGTADTIQHVVVESKDPYIINIRNITRTWNNIKRQFPLLGSCVSDRGDKGGVFFVVEESRLDVCGSDEIKSRVIESPQEAQRFVDDLVNGERSLSNTLLARLLVLYRADDKSRVHFVLHVAHCITDGIANASLLKNFLDVLSSPSSRGELQPVEERLELAIASEHLIPKVNNKARERWYRAIGHIIASIRMQKITGGHTLPRRVTQQTLSTPARSATVFTSLTVEDSIRVVSNCRKYGITFGNAFPVLGQIALTRVLCRHFINGHITDEEWEYRKREPMTTGGPLNLRPFLDHGWLTRGGFENVSVAISFFFHTLPFMPLGLASGIQPGDLLPTFGDLLTPSRFLLRCNIMKQEARRLVHHPRFFEIAGARAQSRVDRLKAVAMQWKDNREFAINPQSISVKDQGLVFTHGGSSLGNVDLLLPREYPLSREAGEAHRVHLVSSQTKLHCRPGELYLGAATTRQQMHLSVYWDENVYEEAIVDEWLREIKGATLYYLASNEPCNPTRIQVRL